MGPLLAALAAFALHAACWGRYAVFRDELYFIVCGERLAAGYVDQPPLIAVVARAAHALFGTWVPGLRLLPWAASSLTAWLAGRLALRLGAGGFGATLAALAVATSPLLAILAASKGKFYYAAPLLPLLFAAGAAAAERVLRRAWALAAATVAVAAGGLALLPIVLPLLPPEGLVAYMAAIGYRPPRLERLRESPLPQIDADQFGWEDLARGVAEVYARLPEDERRQAVVFGRNYGEAAAIDVYGEALGLPPAVSGHNHYFVWGVPQGRGAVAIVISDAREDCGRGLFRRRDLAARLPENAWAMPYESGRWIWICRDPAAPLASVWPSFRHYE